MGWWPSNRRAAGEQPDTVLLLDIEAFIETLDLPAQPLERTNQPIVEVFEVMSGLSEDRTW